MKLSILFSLLSLQAASILARDSQDQEDESPVSFNNILARLEENTPSTLYTLSNRIRDGFFARDSHFNGKRQGGGGNNLTSPSNPGPSTVPTITIPTVEPTTDPEPTNGPSPTETDTDTETETDTDTDTETDTGTGPGTSPTNTIPDQPTSTSSTTSDDDDDSPTTSSFHTQTRPPSSSSSTSSTTTTSESTTESENTTSDEETTRAPTSRTTLSTTTLPDGTESTITSVTVVNPTAEVTEDSPTETRGDPGLQTGAAAGNMISNNEFLALFGAALFAFGI